MVVVGNNMNISILFKLVSFMKEGVAFCSCRIKAFAL